MKYHATIAYTGAVEAYQEPVAVWDNRDKAVEKKEVVTIQALWYCFAASYFGKQKYE